MGEKESEGKKGSPPRPSGTDLFIWNFAQPSHLPLFDVAMRSINGRRAKVSRTSFCFHQQFIDYFQPNWSPTLIWWLGWKFVKQQTFFLRRFWNAIWRSIFLVSPKDVDKYVQWPFDCLGNDDAISGTTNLSSILIFFCFIHGKIVFCLRPISQSVIIISEASKAHRIEYTVVALSIYRVVCRKAIDRIPMTNYIASTPNNNIITMKQFFTCRPNDTFHQQQSQSNRTRWE